MSPRRAIGPLMALVLVLSACGSPAPSGPTAVPSVASSSPTATPIPSADAAQVTALACPALKKIDAALGAYNDGVDLTKLSLAQRQARVKPLDAAIVVAYTDAATVLTGAPTSEIDAFRAPLIEYFQGEAAVNQTIADISQAATNDAAFDEAFSDLVPQLDALDRGFVIAVGELAASVRLAARPLEHCLPSNLRGEPVAGTTVPAFKEIFRDDFVKKIDRWPISVSKTGEYVVGYGDGGFGIVLKKGPLGRLIGSGGNLKLSDIGSLGDVSIAVTGTRLLTGDGGVGILCRAGKSFIHYYKFFVGFNGNVSIERVENDNVTTLANRYAGTLAALAAGDKFQFGATCVGDGVNAPIVLTLWQGTRPVLMIDDPNGTYTDGQVGFMAYAADAPAGALFTGIAVATP